MLIFAGLLTIGALGLLFVKDILAPLSAYLMLLCVYFTRLLPLNNTIILTWLCMTVIVMGATMMQPLQMRAQHRGVGYLIVGALAGMAVGLLGFSLATDVSMLYGLMIVGTVAGSFFGYFLYSTTPEGKNVSLRSGHFFSYLLAKGFPVAITVMEIGIVIVLMMAVLYPAATN